MNPKHRVTVDVMQSYTGAIQYQTSSSDEQVAVSMRRLTLISGNGLKIHLHICQTTVTDRSRIVVIPKSTCSKIESHPPTASPQQLCPDLQASVPIKLSNKCVRLETR